MAVINPWWFAAAGLGLGAVVLAARQGPSAPAPVPGGGWADRYAPGRIRAYAEPIEQLAGWPGLGDFLVAVAWTESRGNSQAVNRTERGNPNVARGWFQIRPKSARTAQLGLSPDALFDEPTAVALAAWYAERLRKFAAPGQTIDWLALRRGWALPGNVDDVDESKQRSRDTRRRFSQGVSAAGLPQSFMYAPAFGPQYDWPGIDAVLQAVGRTRG